MCQNFRKTETFQSTKGVFKKLLKTCFKGLCFARHHLNSVVHQHIKLFRLLAGAIKE